jgi:hypothetical protein
MVTEIQTYFDPWLSWEGAMIFIVGLLLVTLGAGQIIKRAMSTWSNDPDLRGGLINAGTIIGNLERILVFLFLIFGLYTGVGFLIASKSILRFSSTREDRKMAEYVLIGTLWSFTLAVIISLISLFIIHLV